MGKNPECAQKKRVESIPERLKEVTVNRGFQTLDGREMGRLLEETRDLNVLQSVYIGPDLSQNSAFWVSGRRSDG